MQHAYPLLLAALLFSSGASPSSPAPSGERTEPQGSLVIVGGGGTTAAIQRATLERCRGSATRVVILPQASEAEDRGADSREMWLRAGAQSAVVLDPLERESALAAIAAADLIWMPGGAQTRLARALSDADLVPAVRRRYAAGAVVGGTSAGAAVMSEIMISGRPEPKSLVSGAMAALTGLGLWPEAIVDQHFLARGRADRLLTAVLDHPERLGVGVGERTAAIVAKGAFEVLGEGHVLVYDARPANVAEARRGENQAATGLRVHVLKSGMRFRWRE